MRILRLAVCGLALLSLAARRDETAETAFRAQALLGPGVWSRVLRISNNQPGRGSRFPAEFYGLVFAFEGMLWLYTGLDGTQSLSLVRGRLADDEADPGPLLLAIERGLTSFAEVTALTPAEAGASPLPHDCFIRCVARWQELQQEANPPVRARLLACYAPSLPEGHTILEFWRDGRRRVFDPYAPARLKGLPWDGTDDPVELARAIFPPEIIPRPSKVLALELRPGGSRPESPQITVSVAHARGQRLTTL
jgi:hypothetical protein